MSERESANKMEMGPKKYRERIQRDSKFADSNKNLPYTFGKRIKHKAQNVVVSCTMCGKEFFVTEDTVLAECVQCKKLIKVKNIRKKGFFDE